MKKILLSVLLLGTMTTQAQTVTMSDGTTRPLGDMNGDGEVNISDVTAIVNKILGKTPEPEPEPAPVPVLSCPDDHHPHLIDLGLPSGTLWACCNVGASSPEGYGNYYAWGETQTKDKYSWSTYQYGYYNNDGDYSHLVNIGSDIAGTQYDAATANWGTSWRMPTSEEIQELLDNTTSTWTTQNGVKGRKFKGTNSGTVFLPSAGYRLDGASSDKDISYYWSSSLYEKYQISAFHLFFSSRKANRFNNKDRYYGCSVRPVRKN